LVFNEKGILISDVKFLLSDNINIFVCKYYLNLEVYVNSNEFQNVNFFKLIILEIEGESNKMK